MYRWNRHITLLFNSALNLQYTYDCVGTEDFLNKNWRKSVKMYFL